MNNASLRTLGRSSSEQTLAPTSQHAEIQSPADAYARLQNRRGKLTRLLFWIVVVIPSSLAFVYYTFVAAPRYVSEAKFIVRSVTSPQITGLDVLFRTIGIAKTADDAYIIQRYLESRDALEALKGEGVDVRAIFTRPEADFLSVYPHFWRTDSQEALYDYYGGRVTVSEDAVKGIVQLKVTAFQAEDAYAMTQALLKLAEQMVNRINERAQNDTIETARQEVARAEAGVMSVQSEITAYRNTQLLVDPSKSAQTTLETIGKLTEEKMGVLAQVKQLEATAPRSPSLQSLIAKASALDDRIKDQQGSLAGGDNALAGKLEQYEQLVLKRELADKVLTTSLQSFDDALKEARRQHIYVEQVVRPSLPDDPAEPRRIRAIITAFVLGMTLFSIGWVLIVGSGEHLH